MNYRTFLVALAMIATTLVFAQDTTKTDTTYWISGGLSSITFSQVSLSNWSAGGDNSASISSFLSVFADYKKDRHKWQNSMDLAYGLLKQGNKSVRKSDDKINLVTNYGYQVKNGNDRWFINGFVDFRSQFVAGYSQDDPDSVISRFMAPGYLTVGTGIEYSPNKYVSFGYKPVTGKITIVTDDKIVGTEGAYGVEPGKNVRTELGSYFRFTYKQEAFTNVNIDTRLELFTNYQKANFGNIDVNWQNSIVMRVNKYLSTNLFTQLLYDDDIKTETVKSGESVMAGARTQFKSVFGVGLVYEFGTKRPKAK